MKFLTLVGAFLATVSAQSVADIPECGQGCILRVVAQASALGCTSAEASCLCTKPNFLYGLRDCAYVACGSTVGAQVVSYGNSYCAAYGLAVGGSASAGSVTSFSASAVASATGGSSAATATTSGAATTATGATSTAAVAPGGPVAISTGYQLTTISESATTIISTLSSTTLYSTEASATPVTTIPLVGVETAGGSTFTTITGSSTVYGVGAGATGGSATTSATGASGATTAPTSTVVAAATSHSSTSTGGAAQQTAMAGFMAVAGLAALML